MPEPACARSGPSAPQGLPMRILITGATNGMGRGVADALAARGHDVVVHGRSAERCATTAAELAAATGRDPIPPVVADLSSLAQTRAAVGEVTARFDHLDAIFVNAGLGYLPAQARTEDGLDPHFQVNYLSHFLLVRGLLPLLARAPQGGRVVFNIADFGELDLDDLQMDRGWGYERGVGQGMVAKRMLLVELDARAKAAGDESVAFLGFHTDKAVWTNQLTLIPFGMRFMARLANLFGQFLSMEQCGEMMAPLFTEPHAESLARSGTLVTWRKGRFETLPHPAEVEDADKRARLWAESERLCDRGAAGADGQK